jgi:hypothetical protein
VVVRIYDVGASDVATRRSAIDVAAEIFARAGLAIEWHDCTDGVDRACQRAGVSRDLIVRLMPSSTGLRGRRSAEVHANVQDADFPLGFAVVDPSTHTGAMATIFNDQVVSVARRSSIDISALLGRAVAHELGHLLLRARGHSRTGLMRAVWTDEELAADRPADWVFSDPPSSRDRYTSR